MYAEVQRVETLSPDLVRVVLAGGTLDQFEGSDATDAYVNARFLPPESPVQVPFGPDDLDGVADEHRPRPRRFTVRSWDPVDRVLAIDFVVHGDVGYAGRWARNAKPGDRLQFEGPGGSYSPSPDVDWHLLVGDESALGAIGASLDRLGPGERAVVFAVVDTRGAEIDLSSAGDVVVHWLYRDEAEALGLDDPESWVADGLARVDLPAGTFDVFVHGEAGEVRAVRRHLEVDRGVDLSSASISPYWRRKHTDEEWRKVKREWMAAERA